MAITCVSGGGGSCQAWSKVAARPQRLLTPCCLPARACVPVPVRRMHACRLYDEIEPLRILDVRAAPGGAGRQFLMAFDDGRDDEWVPEKDVGGQVGTAHRTPYRM